MLEGMIERTRAELGVDAQVIVTGGLAPLFAGRSPLFDHVDADLTLHGLRLIYDRVQAAREETATTPPAELRSMSAARSREVPDAV
jgi:type III pantothenate kinase